MKPVEAPRFPATHRWPVTVSYGRLRLAPFRPRLADEIAVVRARNTAWLVPWDATSPTAAERAITASQRMRSTTAAARQGLGLPWVIRWATGSGWPLVGQCTVSGIVYGAVQSGSIGYWVDKAFAGHSIAPAAVALATDYAMATLGLHRIEICIRPENRASLRVVDKLGLRYEGRRPRFVHIAGAWCDHEVFAVTAEEVGEGLLARLPRSVCFPDG